MLFDTYDENQLLINTNFKAVADDADTCGYRGELVLIEGEVADAKGRRKPPHAVLRNAVLLAVHGKLQFICGCLDRLDLLPVLVDKYKGDFSADMGAMLFVVNITRPMQVELEGVTFTLLPMIEGIAWNELVDELRMEKAEFKGQSSAQKIVTVWNGFKSYRSKAAVLAFDAAQAFTADIRREGYGAV